jgi:FixJ family two-component response regulator
VQLPGISGVELQSRLKADDNRTPFILITALSDESIRNRVRAARTFGYLSNPFNEASSPVKPARLKSLGHKSRYSRSTDVVFGSGLCKNSKN